MQYDRIVVPARAGRIATNRACAPNVPDRPIVPYFDGIGIHVAPAVPRAVHAAVAKAVIRHRGD